ncbi:MAG: beta-ketoacyl-[acyl-carrier-protein] synthase family protein [Pseudomonadota bacterium]
MSLKMPVSQMVAEARTRIREISAVDAIAMAGVEFDEETQIRTACIIGSGIGGQGTFDRVYYDMLKRERRPHPLTILRVIPNAPASHVSIKYGLRGPSFAIASACASATHSIGVAADLIRAGSSDVAVAGASEAVLTYGSMEAWNAMRMLAPETCRPFSKNRNGLAIGEGAGVLVLEEEERARARGAEILARVAGFAMNADGNDMINPSLDGAAGAMRAALESVRIDDPGALYVNAHGTGTLLNDPTETKAIRTVFGADADALIVSSTKSMHGHLLGGAGGVEAIASILAIRNGVVPPTINLDEPDPDCDLNYAPNEAVERRVDLAVSNSFAFGGMNAVAVFERA